MTINPQEDLKIRLQQLADLYPEEQDKVQYLLGKLENNEMVTEEDLDFLHQRKENNIKTMSGLSESKLFIEIIKNSIEVSIPLHEFIVGIVCVFDDHEPISYNSFWENDRMLELFSDLKDFKNQKEIKLSDILLIFMSFISVGTTNSNAENTLQSVSEPLQN